MTKKEKELELIYAFDLIIGDKIKIEDKIYKIIEDIDEVLLENQKGHRFMIYLLISEDWEKLKLSIKDKRCKDFQNCQGCPFLKRCGLDCTCIDYHEDLTLEEIYKKMEEDLFIAKQEIFGDGE